MAKNSVKTVNWTVALPEGYKFTATIAKTGRTEVDPFEIPEGRNRVYVLEYALQRVLNDYANAKGAESPFGERMARAEERRDNLYDVDWVPGRTGGSGEPVINDYIRRVVRKNLNDESKVEYKALGTDAAAKAAFLWNRYETKEESIKTAIDNEARRLLDKAIAEIEEAKAEAAKLAEAGIVLKL